MYIYIYICIYLCLMFICEYCTCASDSASSHTSSLRMLNVGCRLCNLDLDKINIRGGALSRGHPIGASGAILVVRLFNELIKKPETFGMAAIAAAGGIGSAMMLKS